MALLAQDGEDPQPDPTFLTCVGMAPSNNGSSDEGIWPGALPPRYLNMGLARRASSVCHGFDINVKLATAPPEPSARIQEWHQGRKGYAHAQILF